METVYVTAMNYPLVDPDFLIALILLILSEVLSFMPRVQAGGVIQLIINIWKFLFFKDPSGKDQPKQWNR